MSRIRILHAGLLVAVWFVACSGTEPSTSETSAARAPEQSSLSSNASPLDESAGEVDNGATTSDER